MSNFRKFRLLSVAAALMLILAACIPGFAPGLRNIHNQTWSSDFVLNVTPLGLTTISLPVTLNLTFEQRLMEITADTDLEYSFSIFQLNFGESVATGHINADDYLSLENRDGLFQFEGRFVGDQLRGSISIGGFVPVGDVTFTRTK